MDVGTVCKVFMCNGHMQIVATEDSDSDVKCHLVDLDSLADGVNVEQEEAIVEQRVSISVMFTAKLFTRHASHHNTAELRPVLLTGQSHDICRLRLRCIGHTHITLVTACYCHVTNNELLR